MAVMERRTEERRRVGGQPPPSPARAIMEVTRLETIWGTIIWDPAVLLGYSRTMSGGRGTPSLGRTPGLLG